SMVGTTMCASTVTARRRRGWADHHGVQLVRVGHVELAASVIDDPELSQRYSRAWGGASDNSITVSSL
ncbi:hypothetical protein, partial [Rhodococcus koreensis]|uniref:hypothetical protein n=1 Tax=Rhodococcus koreensis TaxID=99653 RepID=UPI003672BADF